MEKKIYNYFKSILLVFTLILFFCGNVVFSQASEIVIIKNNGEEYKNYTNIQNAIDAASNGDAIFIPNGTYNENLIINKSISIKGQSRENTIIEGEGSEILIHVSEKDVNITKLTLINGNIGIYIRGINNVFSNTSISNVSLMNNNVSLYFSSVSNSKIINSTISNNTDGIILYNSSYNLIKNNLIDLNGNIGISLWENSNNNQISFNIIYDNDLGLLFKRWLDGNVIYNNIFNNNSLAIYLILFSNTTFYDNIINDNYYGIRLKQSLGNNSIFNNTIVNNYYGLDIDKLAEYNLTLNYIINNTYDIKYEAEMPRIKTPGFDISIVIILVVGLIFFFIRKKILYC